LRGQRRVDRRRGGKGRCIFAFANRCLRRRKCELIRRFRLPEDLLPGSLSLTHRRCGKPTCHRAEGEGHPIWFLTFMAQGKKRLERIPAEWVEQVRGRVEAGRQFQDPLREVLTANAELAGAFSKAAGPRQGQSARKRPHPEAIRHHALHHRGLKSSLRDPGDGRQQAQMAGGNLTWAVLLGRIRQGVSFHETEWLAHSPARAGLGIERPVSDDTLTWFTERRDPAVTRRAPARLIRQAKRNKALQDSPRIGPALDGTSAGCTHKRPCPLCHPLRDKQGRTGGSWHRLVMVSVVGAGLSLPVDVEPYGPGHSEYAAGQRLLRRAVQPPGPRFADYVVVDAAFARGPLLEEARQPGLAVAARRKENLPELDPAARQRFHQRAPDLALEEGDERIELCDADEFDPWEGSAGQRCG
jgi:hypothetical protein